MNSEQKHAIRFATYLFLISLALFLVLYKSPKDQNQEITEVSASEILGMNTQQVETLPVEEFDSRLSSDTKAILIDVRTVEEFNSGYIKGAINIDIQDNFRNVINEFPKDRTYFIYSRSGKRSTTAVQMMKDLGFSHLIELEDGIVSWQNALKPINVQSQ